jgi:predicted SAM-dependent methyltransferase
MEIGKLSLKRNIISYGKVQSAYSAVIRCNPFFVNWKRIKGMKLLNVGCGSNTKAEFINLDYSWVPGIDICWDITRKAYPLTSNSLEGIYSEHCLEHIPMKAFETNLQEFHRLLVDEGILRIVMPDGELYMDIYHRKKQHENVTMPYEDSYITPMARINGLFRNFGHQFIYDFETVRILLERNGFRNIRRLTCNQGHDKRLLIDAEWRAVESLYVEATK